MDDSSNLPFKYIGGSPALDLVNTVDWTSHGPEQERLNSYDRFTRWAEGAGVLSTRAAAGLRRRAAAHPRKADTALNQALRARAVLHEVFTSSPEEKPAGGALDEFNRMLSKALEHLRVVPDRARPTERSLRLGWDELDSRLDSPLWPVLWSAASLLSSAEASHIRVCGAPECGWMYVDRSRNGLRRWCQMETCGTREKSRRRYLKVSSEQ